MSRINHLITADGQCINVRDYNFDSAQFCAAVRAHNAAVARTAAGLQTFGVNLYNSANAPFCLGSRLHRDGSTACQHASTANYFSTFEMKYDSDNRTVTLVRSDGTAAAQKRYAVFTGSKFRKPTYATYSEAYATRQASSELIVEIGVRGTKVVSLRAV